MPENSRWDLIQRSKG